MKKAVIILAIMLTAMMIFGSQESRKPQFSNYQEMRKYMGELYQQKKFKEAAELLENHLAVFPDNIRANTYNLALVYVQLNEPEKGIKALEYALDHGIWFGKFDFFGQVWDALKQTEGFKAIQEINEARRMEVQKTARPKLEVQVPEDYDKNKKYPLFIALHGGGENIEIFKPMWTSSLLKKEFIVAYPQSSLVISMTGFAWTEDLAVSRREIKEAYDKIIGEYPIDAERVIIGGFSSGGVASLDVVLKNTLPVRGFVVLCPARPDDFTAEKVREIKSRGIRGTLITTEMDGRLAAQKEMAEIMKAEGLPHEFVVTPDLGHWYPDDLDKKIDEGILHILNINQ